MPVETRRRKNAMKEEENSTSNESKKQKKTIKKEAEINQEDFKEDFKAIKTEVSKTKVENQGEAYWLMKSEPETRMQNGQDMKFGIEDLKKMPNQIEHWDGVRNYQARNYMKSMKLDEKAFFYHSNCKVPGIAGIMKIVREFYPDHTQFDQKDVHYDPKSDKSNPKWFMVDVKFERDLKRFIPLTELKDIHLLHKSKNSGGLENLSLFTQSRLSIQSISRAEWDFILDLENK